MRILQIDKFLDCSVGIAGGISRYIEELSGHLRRDGHEVVSFGCAGPGDSAARPAFFDFAATRNPLAVFRMIHNRSAARLLDAFLAKNPVEVAHVHNIYHHLTPSIFPVLHRHGIGVAMTMHDYRLLCPTKHFLRSDGVCFRCQPNRFWHASSSQCAGRAGMAAALESYVQRFAKRYIRGVDMFLCPTETMKAFLLEAGYPEKKLRVFRNFVARFDAPNGETVDKQASRHRIVFAGRISPEKRVELCLDVARAIPDATVVIAGDGPALAGLQELAERESLDNVEFTGHLERGALGQLYASATLVLLTSEWIENSPAAMLEPMAMGCCMVVPDHRPLREWVIDRQTGRLFAADSASAGASLVAVCRELLADASQRQQLGQSAKEKIAAMHDEAMLFGELLDVYHAIARR